MNHQLFIHIDQESTDPNFIFVRDSSTYLAAFPPENRLLDVTIPGRGTVVTVPFPRGKYIGYDSVLLNMFSTRQALPDGQWSFLYSVAPNSKVFHKVYHFRTVQARIALSAAIMQSIVNCDNGIDDCGNVILDKKQNLLMHAGLLLSSATELGKDIRTAETAYKQYQAAMTEINLALRINKYPSHV